MSTKLAVVEELYASNFRDAAAALREIAAQIEKGDFGDVGTVAVAVFGNTLEVFGLGPDSTRPSVHVVLCAAARKIEQWFLEHD